MARRPLTIADEALYFGANTLTISSDLAVSTLAHYKLDELSGTDIVDSSGNGNTGTYVNSPTLGQPAPTGFGVLFNGTTQLGNCPVAPTAYPFTMAGWFRPDTGTNMYLFSVCDASATTKYCAVLLTSSRALFHVRYDTAAVSTNTGLSLVDDEWVHVVFVFEDATTVHVYLDGVLRYSNDSLTSVPFNADIDALAIGNLRITSPFQFFKGVIDDVRLYSLALDATDVYAVYSGALSDPNEFDSMAIGLSIGL